VLDGFGGHTVFLEPLQGLPVKRLDSLRELILKLRLKKIPEERVVLVPGADGSDKQVRLLNLRQQLPGIFRDHDLAERQGKLVQDRRVEQKSLNVARLLAENLR
jgi:hypothetical protein